MLQTIAVIADFAGILSFILSIMLLIKSEALRKSIIYQRIDYNKKRTNTRSKLMAFNETLQEDASIAPKYISEMRQELYQCLISYQFVLSFRDRHIIRSIIKLLNTSKENRDKAKICKQLDYLIARFNKKEDS